MDDSLKNNLFLAAVDYLFQEKMVTSQKDLAQKIGIKEASMSRIKNGQRCVSDDTLRKMNEAFGHIFNMQYFRGKSTKMLMEDVIYYEQHPHEDKFRTFDRIIQKPQDDEEESTIAAEHDTIQYQTLPPWASSLIDIMAKQIKENEALHRELRQTIIELQNTIINLKK